MMQISIEAVVSVPGTRSLWPEELKGFETKLQDDHVDKGTLAVLADWFMENDEPGLERACRYIVNRTSVKIEYDSGRYYTRGLPVSIGSINVYGAERSTIMGTLAELSARLRIHDEEGK